VFGHQRLGEARCWICTQGSWWYMAIHKCFCSLSATSGKQTQQIRKTGPIFYQGVDLQEVEEAVPQQWAAAWRRTVKVSMKGWGAPREARDESMRSEFMSVVIKVPWFEAMKETKPCISEST
jgi:hypothetical protein